MPYRRHWSRGGQPETAARDALFTAPQTVDGDGASSTATLRSAADGSDQLPSTNRISRPPLDTRETERTRRRDNRADAED